MREAAEWSHMTPSALTGEAAIVETRRDLRLLPAVANALAHLPPSWRINLIHGGQLSPSCVATYLGAPDRLRVRRVLCGARRAADGGAHRDAEQ